MSKETVPVELVHLGKESVTEQQSVIEKVAKEVIDIDQDTDTGAAERGETHIRPCGGSTSEAAGPTQQAMARWL